MSFRLVRVLELLCLLLIFFAVQYFGILWLFNPELTYDEGYYIMAARRMIEGDWFLQLHSFDKPFLHPLLVSMSGLIFGTSFLGYRILGWILFSASFFIYAKTLDTLFFKYDDSAEFKQTSLNTFIKLTAKFLILIFIFLHPVMIKNAATSMGEPFLMFFMCLTLLSLTLTDPDRQRSFFMNSFTLAFWIKGSILVWSPFLLLFNWNKSSLKKLWETRRWLWPAIIVSSVGLWYGLIGKTKLFVFRYLLDVLFGTEGSDKIKLPFFQQLSNWNDLLVSTFGYGISVIALIALATLFYEVGWRLKGKKLSFGDWRTEPFEFKLWMACSLTIGLFFAIILLTSVGIADRYLLTITPVVGILLCLIINSTLPLKSANFISYLKLILIFSCLLSIPITASQWRPGPPAMISYISPSIERELPFGSTLINKIVWPHGTYVPNDLKIIEVPYDTRLNRHYGQLFLIPAVFAFNDDYLFEALQYKDPLSDKYCPEIKRLNEPLLTLSFDQLKSIILKSFMAEGKLHWDSFDIKLKKRRPSSEFLKHFPLNFFELTGGAILSARLRSNEKVLGEYPLLDIQADLIFYSDRSVFEPSLITNSLNNQLGQPFWALGIRLNKFVWENQKMDLRPFLLASKKGLTFPILPIRVPKSLQRPFEISTGIETSGAAKILINGIESQLSCGAIF